MIAPASNCYNPYCDCHVVENEENNSILKRDEDAMDQIVEAVHAGPKTEKYHASLLDGLTQRQGPITIPMEDDKDSNLDRLHSTQVVYHGKDSDPDLSILTEEDDEDYHLKAFKFHEVKSSSSE